MTRMSKKIRKITKFEVQSLAEPHDVQVNRCQVMKKTIICGNLGKDAECKSVSGGHKFVQFSVACNTVQKKDASGNTYEETQWADCEIYVKPENSAEGLLKALKKGRHIYLEAYDRVDTWIDNTTKEARARIIYRVLSFDI